MVKPISVRIPIAILLTFILTATSGCGGITVSKNDSHASNYRSLSPSKVVIPGQNDYAAMLTSMGLNEVFTFGETHETVSNNQVTFITVSLDPKDIDANGDKPGGIIQDREKLSQFGVEASIVLGEKIGINPSEMKFVIHEGSCRAEIFGSTVITACDRGETIEINGINHALLNDLDALIKQLKKTREKSNKLILNYESVSGYCNKTLPSKISSVSQNTIIDCNRVSVPTKETNAYIIGNVNTVGFLTRKFSETFDIKISYSNIESSPSAVVFEVINAKFSPAAIASNKATQDISEYPDNKKSVSDAERFLATWYQQQMNVAHGNP